MKGTLDIADLQRRAEDRLAAGAAMEDVLTMLRDSRCNVIESIKIVSAAAGISRGDAKLLVHRSATWRDVREAHEGFHETVEQVARETGDSAP